MAFFLLLFFSFSLLDPDLHIECGFGSGRKMNADPDPQLIFRNTGLVSFCLVQHHGRQPRGCIWRAGRQRGGAGQRVGGQVMRRQLRPQPGARTVPTRYRRPLNIGKIYENYDVPPVLYSIFYVQCCEITSFWRGFGSMTSHFFLTK